MRLDVDGNIKHDQSKVAQSLSLTFLYQSERPIKKGKEGIDEPMTVMKHDCQTPHSPFGFGLSFQYEILKVITWKLAIL